MRAANGMDDERAQAIVVVDIGHDAAGPVAGPTDPPTTEVAPDGAGSSVP